MKITITTLVITFDDEVQDVIHSLNEDPAKAEQEIIEEVNSTYSDGESTFSSIKEIKEHFEEENPFHTSIVHLESQEISLQPNGTVIKDIEP